jgi:polyvinyl alcohol dehydrogenase (cytochrome)
VRRGLLGLVVVALAVVSIPLARADEGAPECPRPSWPMYGHDLAHSFSQDPGCAAITLDNVATLVPKWFVPTPDSVTASPTVVDDIVYVGDWAGNFYARDAETGEEKWTFVVDDDHKVAFGRIVSSAAVARFRDHRQRAKKVVLFGGGATLYALDALTGQKLAAIDLDPRDEATEQAQADDPPDVEIESSPAVVGDRIWVGMDVHNARQTGRTGIVSLRLQNQGPNRWAFVPLWKFDPETRQVYEGREGLTAGSGQGFGCGGVWSSPAVHVDERGRPQLVFFGTSNCNHVQDAFDAGENWAESMFAIRADTGEFVWQHRPAEVEFDTWDEQKAEAHADDDFGASPNIFSLADGRTLVGQGRKSATYYARDAVSGAPVWQRQAGHHGRADHNFSLGGFLGTTAVEKDASGQAVRIVGATAVPIPRPDQREFPDSVERSTWAVKAMNATTGRIEWIHRLAGPAYGSVTIANGVVFVPNTFSGTVQALDAATGVLLWTSPVFPSSSAPAVVGDSIYLGGGTRETDLEYKTVAQTGIDTQALASAVGPHPLSPASGIFAFHLAG